MQTRLLNSSKINKMIHVKKLSKGDYVICEGEPYRVQKMELKVVSKHSHTRAKLELLGMFSGNRRVMNLGPHETMEDVEIVRKHGQFISKGDGRVQVMSMDTYEMVDAEISPELFEGIKEGDEVTYIEFRGRTKVLEIRK